MRENGFFHSFPGLAFLQQVTGIVSEKIHDLFQVMNAEERTENCRSKKAIDTPNTHKVFDHIGIAAVRVELDPKPHTFYFTDKSIEVFLQRRFPSAYHYSVQEFFSPVKMREDLLLLEGGGKSSGYTSSSLWQ